MRRGILVVLVVLAGAALVFLAGAWLRPAAPEGWTEVLSRSFADGPREADWGWGEWRFVDGCLELADRTGEPTVYMLPVPPSRDEIVETEVQIVESVPGRRAGAHLITRASEYLESECGIVVYAGSPEAYLRHRVDLREQETLAELPGPIEPGSWHVLRIEVQGGVFTASVDGAPVATMPGAVSSTGYAEPHLAVENGVARFRSIRVMAAGGPVVAAAPVGAARPSGRGAPPHHPWWVNVLRFLLWTVVAIVCVYMVRHYVFTLNRLFGRQRHPYLDVDTADWPHVTVLIPAHDEEPVIGEILEALLAADYPADRLRIVPIDDRSRDRTGEIIDELARRHPGRVTPFRRTEGKAGKAAALRDAMTVVEDDIVLVFDADYIPGRGLVKQLVAPFFDPEVGAVMGRVVPHNVGQNLLTRVLDLERAGGYQVDQQARMNLRLVPQYGGTVGGVRAGALQAAGGWKDDSLAEDTDATYRLLLAGWKVVYQNRSECYEQVPDTWPMRMRQLLRWARGHNQVSFRYARRLLFDGHTRPAEKLDGFLLLNVYLMSPVLLFGWMVGIVLWFLGVNEPGLIVILVVASYSTLGNFAIFFEIAAAAYLDGSRERIRLLPLVLPAFLVSLTSVTRATFTQAVNGRPAEDVLWHKTEHNNRGHVWK